MTETLEESMHVPLTLGSKQHNTHAYAHIVTQTYIITLNNTGKMVPRTPSSPPHHLNQISPSPLIDSVPSATMKVFIGSKGSWWHAHLDHFKALSFILLTRDWFSFPSFQALQKGFFNFDTFDVEEYEHYEVGDQNSRNSQCLLTCILLTLLLL